MSSSVPRGPASSSSPAASPIGRYSLLERLGKGGMGAVYRAHDQVTGRMVAFKQLLSSRTGDRRKQHEALFEREYRTLLRLKHPRIIEVFDYGFSESGPYYTMELLEGADLHRLSPLPYAEACQHLRDLASSLALIHAHRLVHRDVTPRNVRLTPDGRSKLIDFGALASFGPMTELVGTPGFVAPEALLRIPVDQRADLFALGAVGYYALTGRQAYQARRFEQLPELWKQAPQPPSQLVPGIPAELDTLILSLLSVDPLSRPSSAAAVIDALTRIGGFAAEAQELATEIYLASGRLVGRQAELAACRKRIARGLTGSGASVVIEGAAGTGKTRLLQELALEAQLRGVTVLKADALSQPDFFGVASSLALQLIDMGGALAERAAAPHVELLAQLGPELQARLRVSTLAPLAGNPDERRARCQTALHEWFSAVAAERTLLLAVDNLHAADEASTAFLAALASEARSRHLIILATQRSNEHDAAPPAQKVLRKRGTRLTLGGFDALACEQFVESLFGAVANTGRVARLLFERSGGNPRQCAELAQLLAKRQIAKYTGGTWVLPLEVSRDELPACSDELVAMKLAELSSAARDMVEALSLARRPASMERCLELCEPELGHQALVALDELIAAQILLVDTGGYRFQQQAVREAVLAQIPDDRRAARHLHAAETLLKRAGDDLALRMEAGWHLLHGGAERRGADLLAKTARAFLKSAGAAESVDEIVQALHAALEVYERVGASEHELAGLLFPLVPLGYYSSDWRVPTRHAARACELGLNITGLALAARLQPLLGKSTALRLSRRRARSRFAHERKRGRELAHDLDSATLSFCAIVPATVATFSTCFDGPAAEDFLRAIGPLQLLDKEIMPSLAYTWADAQALSLRGQERKTLQAFERIAERLRSPEVSKALGEGHRKTMYGGALFALALQHCYCCSPRVLELASEMENLGLKIWALTADQVRLLYYAYRGEHEHVQRYRARVEFFAMHGSATWHAEMFWPALLLDADVLCSDTIAARRTYEQLSRRAQDVPSLRLYADAACAAYLTLRGELGPAIELYERIMPALMPKQRTGWLPIRSCYARALNLGGLHERARQLLSAALAATDPEDDIVALHLVEARRQLALAEAGLGHHSEAIQAIEQLFKRYVALDNPLLHGLLHKARAEIALQMQDRVSFDSHLESMEQHFRATGNPALVAQWQRLMESAAQRGLLRARDLEAARDESVMRRHAEQTVSGLGSAPNPCEHALRLLMQYAWAKSGYLYLWQTGRMSLSASNAACEPPPEREAQLHEVLERLERADDDGDGAATIVDAPRFESKTPPRERASSLPAGTASLPASMRSSGRPNSSGGVIGFTPDVVSDAGEFLCIVVLQTWIDGRRMIVGGVILELESRNIFGLNDELLSAVARALYDQGLTELDMTTEG